MALAFKSVAGNTATGRPTTITLTVPSGVVDGDLLIMCIGGETILGSTVATPSGWNLLDNGSGTGGGQFDSNQGTFWRTASAEPASYTVATVEHAQLAMGAIVAYSGEDFTQIRNHAQAVTTTVSTTSPTPATLTGMLLGDFGFISYFTDGTSLVLSDGSWNTRLSLEISFSAGLLIIDKVDGASRPTVSSGVNRNWAVNSIAIAAPQGSGNFLPFFL